MFNVFDGEYLVLTGACCLYSYVWRLNWMEGVGSDNVGLGTASVNQFWIDVSRRYQYYLDKTTPHAIYRWIGSAVIVLIYILRVYYIQGFYIISYGLGIYLLNLLIGFLSPLELKWFDVILFGLWKRLFVCCKSLSF